MKNELKVDHFGRILIPKEVRKELGLEEGTLLSYKVFDGELRIKTNFLDDLEIKTIKFAVDSLSSEEVMTVFALHNNRFFYLKGAEAYLANFTASLELQELLKEHDVIEERVSLPLTDNTIVYRGFLGAYKVTTKNSLYYLGYMNDSKNEKVSDTLEHFVSLMAGGTENED